jgi:hypothetical protein
LVSSVAICAGNNVVDRVQTEQSKGTSAQLPAEQAQPARVHESTPTLHASLAAQWGTVTT